MKKIFFCLIIIFFTNAFVFGQNADSIISKHIEAIGGREKLIQLKTLHIESYVDQAGVKIPVIINAIHQKGIKQEYSFSGMTGYDIITDSAGWYFSPFNGMQQAETKTTEDWKSHLTDMDIQGVLLDYKLKGFEARFIEKDDVDGVECYVIMLALKNNVTKKYYFDPSNYYMLKETTKSEVDGREEVNSIVYSNFRNTDLGIIVPFSQDSNGQITTIEKIVTNGPVDIKIFKRE